MGVEDIPIQAAVHGKGECGAGGALPLGAKNLGRIGAGNAAAGYGPENRKAEGQTQQGVQRGGLLPGKTLQLGIHGLHGLFLRYAVFAQRQEIGEGRQ